MFGVAATRPDEVAQNIPKMAEHLDYVSAMVYPSHWAPGEYGVADPNGEPYEIVQRSLEDFKKDVRGTGARVVPWLQDFSLGVDVRARPGRRADPGGAGRRDRRVPALGPAGHVHRRGAHPPDARTAVFSKPKTPAELAKSLKPNELGLVPVLMHHQIRAARERLRHDRRPAPQRADAALAGRLLPDHRRRSRRRAGSPCRRGRSPVVLTFDDATNNQVSFRPDGSLDPSSGLGVLEAFAKTHHDFPAAATFYVPRNAFDGNGRTPASTLAWLVEHGFELGNHTKDHIPLNTLGPTAVQRQLVLGNQVLSDLLPGYKPTTMALPLGSLPQPTSLATRGSWGGHSYSFAGVFLAGAEPAPSPFSTKWDPDADPADPDEPELERLARLHRRDVARHARAEPGPALRLGRRTRRRSRSRAARESELAPAYRDRAKPY